MRSARAVRAAHRRGARRGRLPLRHQRRREHRRVGARPDRPGDNVVVDELHYNTSFVLLPRTSRRRAGIALRIVKHRDGARHDATISRALVDDRTRARVGGVGLAPERVPARHAAARRSRARPRRAVLHRRGAGARHVSRRRARGRRRLHDERDLQVAARRASASRRSSCAASCSSASASIASARCTSRRSSAITATRSTARRGSSTTRRCRLPRSTSSVRRSPISSASASTGSSVTRWRLARRAARGARRPRLSRASRRRTTARRSSACTSDKNAAARARGARQRTACRSASGRTARRFACRRRSSTLATRSGAFSITPRASPANDDQRRGPAFAEKKHALEARNGVHPDFQDSTSRRLPCRSARRQTREGEHHVERTGQQGHRRPMVHGVLGQSLWNPSIVDELGTPDILLQHSRCMRAPRPCGSQRRS